MNRREIPCIVDIDNTVMVDRLKKDRFYIFKDKYAWQANAESVYWEGNGYKLKDTEDMAGVEHAPDKTKGFSFESPETKKIIQWQEGVPVLHIDEDSFMPVDFAEHEPDDALQSSNMMTTKVNIEVEKRVLQKNFNWIEIIMLVLLVANIAIGYTNYSASGEIGHKVDANTNGINTIQQTINPLAAAQTAGNKAGNMVIIPAAK
jgi:hypothetical protein